MLIDAELLRMALNMMSDEQRAQFEQEVDTAYYYEGHDNDEHPILTLNQILS